eukprot:TRINITY_DN17828_c0_g1_i1.p1 TRINITY_DN17828_c0_g1~~TRINITY_DN17828_c0_g1_i1.p1  ORF type:complete len:498 (-),score=82.49 TRINITY_DN17828_c0_g1_i1:4-1497(-)
MGLADTFTKEELYEKPFPWTIVCGRVYAIGDFIAKHPGGTLIRRAVGEDATELFMAHHGPESPAARVLARFEIGKLAGTDCQGLDQEWRRRPLQREVWSRLNRAGVGLRPRLPLAELIAVIMLVLFAVWAWLSYGCGWWRLNVALAWFWWRHLDAGLHGATHGDFRHRASCHRVLFQIYTLLSRRALEYYNGGEHLRGMGLSKHWWHHIFPNDAGRDPDWSTMTGVVWVRRHESAAWHPCHRWQCCYWLPINTLVEPMMELFQVTCSSLESLALCLEPPALGSPGHTERIQQAIATWTEVLFNPGFQLVAFLVQPFWQAFATLLLARAVSRLVLFPFSEVQHYMPEHIGHAQGWSEWVVGQLHTTANLKFWSWPAWLLDFLMFHGDSHQIEHHLWPAMSFVQYTRAAKVVRSTCAELGLPYHEVGYWEGYRKILGQVVAHSSKSNVSQSCRALDVTGPQFVSGRKRSPSSESDEARDEGLQRRPRTRRRLESSESTE